MCRNKRFRILSLHFIKLNVTLIVKKENAFFITRYFKMVKHLTLEWKAGVKYSLG